MHQSVKYSIALLLRRAVISAALITLSLSAGTATAQITVSTSILELGANNLVKDVDVLNTATHKIFLNMSVAKINNPESDNPVRQELSDPRTAPVLVSPTQMVLLPGQRKRLRVILREVPEQRDDIYRLAVKPFIGDVEVEGKEGVKASALKVLLGYDLLLLARPDNPVAQLQVTRTDTALTFENKGNTNVLLRRLMQCNAQQEDCEELKPNRIYSGEIHTIELPKKGSAERFPVQVWHSQALDSFMKIY